jgi:hypothetical protein
MVDRFLKALLPRLRFALANLQLLPLLAFGLVVAAAIVQLFVLPARERAIDDAERRLAMLERNARRTLVERQVEHVSPEDTRQRLLDHFATESELNEELGRIIEIAGKQGVKVPGGDYRLIPGKDGLFDRYVLNLPVKGGYQEIRRYVATVRSEFPALAVDDITLRRENIGATEVEAQLRFVLFGRRNAS